MNSFQLYDSKINNLFREDQQSSLQNSNKLIQNCSILEIDLDDIEAFIEKNQEKNALDKNQLLNLQYYINKPFICEDISKQSSKIRIIEVLQERQSQSQNSLSNITFKHQRKQLLNEMIQKLNLKQKILKQQQVNDEIFQKIENIVDLLNQVQKQMENKNKCSFGMKLKLKVNPNQNCLKTKCKYQSQDRNIQNNKKSIVKQENKLKHSFVKKIQIQNKQNQRKTMIKSKAASHNNNISQRLLHQKNKALYVKQCNKQINSSERISAEIKLKREQIVQKQIKRREKALNRFISKN